MCLSDHTAAILTSSADGSPALKVKTPVLAHEICAEASVPFLVLQPETGTFVDASRVNEDVVGPQDEPMVSVGPREFDAGVNKGRADPETSRVRFDEQQSKLGRLVVLAYAED
jgi:hypothetical protein